MTTTTPTDTPYTCEGAPIHARGVMLAATYASSWSPSPFDKTWEEYGDVADCWRHAAFPEHVVEGIPIEPRITGRRVKGAESLVEHLVLELELQPDGGPVSPPARDSRRSALQHGRNVHPIGGRT
jgi:hypothetical protein